MMSSQKDRQIFLELLKDAIHGDEIKIKEEEIRTNLAGILQLSNAHMVYPLIVDCLYKKYPEYFNTYKKRAIDQTVRQAAKTASFLLLYKKMLEKNLSPIVLKGIICRNIYTEPEIRVSADEDLLIEPSEVKKYHDFLIEQGFITGNNNPINDDYEIIYRNEKNKLNLGVHKYLFSQEDSAFNKLNDLFKELDNTTYVTINKIDIQTLSPTNHFIYMICHAYKHLVYSGIGIRQLCDMTLFAEKNGKKIDWDKVLNQLKKENLDLFSEALLKICVEDLGMDVNKADCSAIYLSATADKKPLLNDILSGGAYGASDENRLHSANITRGAVASSKSKSKDTSILTSLFPSYDYMANKYDYIKKNRYLLPFAWAQRIFCFLRKSKKDVNPSKTMKIGKERIELLKKYNLI